MNNSREKSFMKNTIIITIGKFCTQLVTFFLLPLYTNILSTEEYGTVDLLNTLVSLLLPIITFYIEQAIFRELIENRENEKNKKEIISSGILIVIMQCLIYLCIFAILFRLIHNQYKIFLVINVLVAIFSSLFLQISRGLGDNKTYAASSFISASSTVILNVVFLVILKMRVNGMLLGTFFGQLLCCIYTFFKLRLYKYISLACYNFKTIKKLWRYSLPLVPNQLSWWIFNVSDRVVVSAILGLSSTGLLSAANKLPSLITTIYGIFYLSFSENILLHVKDKDIKDYYSKMFSLLLGIFISLSVGIVSCMPFIFPIMINKKFSESYNLIPILVIANVFYIIVSMVGVLYSSHKNTKAIASTSIISALINLIVHFALIKFIGLYAAVVSTFVSYFIMAIYRLKTAKKLYFKIKISQDLMRKTLVVSTVVFILYYINNLYLNILSLCISIIFALNINLNSMQEIINMLKNKKKKEKRG